jgi:hypothetical protein
MPYPLPEGDSYEETLVWRLVAVPNRPEYLQAGLGHLTDLAHWYFWGLEGREPGSEDAAQSWHIANAATLELWDMNPLQTLIDQTDEIEALLAAIRDSQCCIGNWQDTVIDDGFEITPVGDVFDTSPFDVADGDTWPPDYLTDPTGETPFADEPAFRAYLCDMANLVVQVLIDLLRLAAAAKRIGWGVAQIISELISWVIARRIPGVLGELTAFTYDMLYDAGTAFAEAASDLAIVAATGAIETAREEIVCAIAEADTFQEALADSLAIIEGIVPAVVFAMLGAGGWWNFLLVMAFRAFLDPGEYQDSDCCVVTYDWDYTWLADGPTDWQLQRAGVVAGPPPAWQHNPRSSVSPSTSYQRLGHDDIVTRTALTEQNAIVQLIEIAYSVGASWSPKQLSLVVYYADGTNDTFTPVQSNGSTGLWVFNPQNKLARTTAGAFQFLHINGAPNGDSGNTVPADMLRITSVRLAGTTVPT